MPTQSLAPGEGIYYKGAVNGKYNYGVYRQLTVDEVNARENAQRDREEANAAEQEECCGRGENGEGYDSKDDAGIAAANAASRLTETDGLVPEARRRLHRREYGGRICRHKETRKFFYTSPIPGRRDENGLEGVNTHEAPCPRLCSHDVGGYHSHPRNGNGSYNPPGGIDLDNIENRFGEHGYVGRGTGNVDRYNATRTVTPIQRGGRPINQ